MRHEFEAQLHTARNELNKAQVRVLSWINTLTSCSDCLTGTYGSSLNQYLVSVCSADMSSRPWLKLIVPWFCPAQGRRAVRGGCQPLIVTARVLNESCACTVCCLLFQVAMSGNEGRVRAAEAEERAQITAEYEIRLAAMMTEVDRLREELATRTHLMTAELDR